MKYESRASSEKRLKTSVERPETELFFFLGPKSTCRSCDIKIHAMMFLSLNLAVVFFSDNVLS